MSLLDDLIENANDIIDIVDNFKSYCTNGEHLVIPEGVTEIKGGIFYRDVSPYYSNNLKSITFPSTLRSIGYQSFRGQSYITELVIPHGVTTISSSAFAGCSGVQRLYLPNTLTICSSNAFTPTSNMTSFEVEQDFNCGLSSNVVFSNANFSADVMVNVFNNLKDRTGETAYTLTFGSNNIAKLTAEQIAIATNKNWNLA